MKRKRAEKILMSVGVDRNTARFVMRQRKDGAAENAEQLAAALIGIILGIKAAQARGIQGPKGFHLRGNDIWAYGERSKRDAV